MNPSIFALIYRLVLAALLITQINAPKAAYAALNDPIECTASTLFDYNRTEHIIHVALSLSEDLLSKIKCRLNIHVSLESIADNNVWAIGNDTTNALIKLRHEGTRFTNFKSSSGITFKADTNTVIPAGKHIITYTDTKDKEDRIFIITIDAGGKKINALTSIKANIPNTAPVITGGDTATVSVAENQTSVIDVETTDDNDREGTDNGLTYSFSSTGGGADNSLFNIDINTGIVTFKVAPDFEKPESTNVPSDNTYDVQVTVTDSFGLTDVQDITVNVTNVVVEELTTTITTDSGGSFNQSAPGTFRATVTFNAAVTGFVDGELTATNATVGSLNPAGGAGTTFTALITPAGTGNVNLNVAKGVAQDTSATANDNKAAPQITVTQNDDVAPTLSKVSIASNNANPTKALPGDTITVTFTANEALQSPAPRVKIAGQNATVKGISTTFSATLVVEATTPLGVATINISGIKDTAENASAPVTATTDGSAVSVGIPGPTVEETQQVILSFIQNRANHIGGTQPNIIGFVDGTNRSGENPLGNLHVNNTENTQVLAFSTSHSKILTAMNGAYPNGDMSPTFSNDKRISYAFGALQSSPDTGSNLLGYSADNTQTDSSDNTLAIGDGTTPPNRAGTYDIWTEVYGAHSSAKSSDSTFWVGYFGAHYFTNDHTLIGIMGQLDWADETNSSLNSKAKGNGWIIGPYIAGQIPNQNLFYEAQVGYGQSDNDVSPIGTYTDSFDTTRWLTTGKISGSYRYDDLTIIPTISLSYYEEMQKTYVDTNNLTIPKQTISLGEIRFGPTFSKRIKLNGGTLFTPTFGISGIWHFNVDNTNTSQTNTIGDDDLRARIDLGLSASNPRNGMIFTLEAFYDGIGASNYDSYGGGVRITIPLQ